MISYNLYINHFIPKEFALINTFITKFCCVLFRNYINIILYIIDKQTYKYYNYLNSVPLFQSQCKYYIACCTFVATFNDILNITNPLLGYIHISIPFCREKQFGLIFVTY